MHWQFSMDRHGNVYLSAGGGIGGIACARFENGRYRAPEKLPAPVNVPHTPEERYRAGELGPFISPGGDYLIFTKFGNGAGLWVTFRQSDGSWGEPKNLSERLGGAGNDSAPQVTPDGKYLFFQSVRPGSAPVHAASTGWTRASSSRCGDVPPRSLSALNESLRF